MQKVYLHPLPVRIWHWINAAGFIALIVTGIQIRYVGQVGLMSYKAAIQLHNWTGFVVIANYFIWLVYYLVSDRIRVYHPELSPKKFYHAAFKQLVYYGWGIFRGDPEPHTVTAYNKFNALQSMTYQVVMLVLVPIQFYTGVLLWDVRGFAGQVNFFGGVRVVATIHVLLFIFFVAYTLVHIYLGSLGHRFTTHYKEMWTGYEEEPEHAKKP
jgi:thiosulfate reductase cytochrome b subunit